MKKVFAKQVAISGVLSALLMMPAAAVEIYNAENGKVDVYGSIRGYMGYGDDATNTGSSRGGYLIGIQNNSQFGVKYAKDKFKANVEYGGVEPGVDGNLNKYSKGTSTGFRQFWGSYDTGMGTILFGKTNTPTIDNGFTNDFFNNDNGSQGFGGIATGSRKIQLQYNIAGFSIALVEDSVGLGRNAYTDNPSQESPRIAAAYTISDEKGAPIFKVAATYKYYNSVSSSVSLDDSGNLQFGTVPKGTNAYHAWVGFRPTFGNAFVSLMAHYGKNGHTYNEQTTTVSFGGYALSALNAGLDAQRAGARAEFGINFTQELGLIAGAGYQATFGGLAQKAADDKTISSYSFFVQLPYKASKNFTFAPQVSYYETSGSTLINADKKQAGVVAAARFKWDF